MRVALRELSGSGRVEVAGKRGKMGVASLQSWGGKRRVENVGLELMGCTCQGALMGS